MNNITEEKNGEVGVTKDMVHRLAFENSFQPTIILSDTDRKICSANKAACQLLEYSEDELLTKNWSAVFVSDAGSFKKMIREREADGQASAIVTAIKKSGELFSCQITSAVFTNDGIEQAVMTLTDMSQSILAQKEIDTRNKKIVADNIVLAKSKQKKLDRKKEKIVAENIMAAMIKSDARLAANNEWIKCIAKTSYDVMWDWDIATGEIYVGDSVEEVFGYKVQNNTVNFLDFLKCLPSNKKDIIEQGLLKALSSDSKGWNVSYLFKRYDGSLASTTSRASIVRDDDNKAVRLIGAIQDVSRLQELETRLGKQSSTVKTESENLLPGTQFSSEVLWQWNIVTNEVFIGDEFEALFGYVIKNNKITVNDWRRYIHPDDKEGLQESLDDALRSSAASWQHSYRLIRANSSVTNVFVRACIFRQLDGKPNRMIGVLQDRNRQQEYGKVGSAVPRDKKSLLIDKIKNVVTELVLFSDELVQTNYSAYLSKKLHYDYTYMANLFSSVEGVSLQAYIITQKINRVKELLASDTLKLTEISRKLHYSSVAHLSSQFKKITGLTPSQYKQQKSKQ